MELGPAATPHVFEPTPRRDGDAGDATLGQDPGANLAKRQLAWEVCSVREVQRQSHLREVREAASVGGTPHSTPTGMEPAQHASLPAVPELTLPPAAGGTMLGGLAQSCGAQLSQALGQSRPPVAEAA